MIAIPTRNKAALTAANNPEKLAALAGNGGVEPNLKVLRRAFTAISNNQDITVAEVQDRLRPDIQVPDAMAANILWLLHDRRMEDLNRERLKSIHMAVARMDYPKPETLGVTPDVEARVKELMERPGVAGRHQDHAINRMGIEQMALAVHMFRLGASTTAIREAIIDQFQGMAFDKIRAMTREYYDFGSKASGWDWNTPPDQCKVLPRIAAPKR